METLNKNMDEHDAVSRSVDNALLPHTPYTLTSSCCSLVIGTESRQILILKPSGTQILSR